MAGLTLVAADMVTARDDMRTDSVMYGRVDAGLRSVPERLRLTDGLARGFPVEELHGATAAEAAVGAQSRDVCRT